ncbi:MAG: VOC family protein [Acidobacteria bacterium]|nr:VOC family protein [Acidobacteriota bacterium]
MTRGGIVVLAVLTALPALAAAEPRQGGTVLTTAEIIAFVGTANAERANVFYRDTLGLRLVSEEPQALVFDAGGRMLRVSIVPQVPPARYTVLGWKVDDIAAAADGLATKGVRFERFAGFVQDARGVWTAPDGTRVAWFRDPDGNMLSLTQFPNEPPRRQP